MVNKCEPLINAVTENKPKVLTSPGKADRLGPKGKGSGIGAPNSPIADGVPPAERRNLTHAGTGTKRGKPAGLPPSGSLLQPKGGLKSGKRAARRADGSAGRGWWKKRMPSCNREDRG